MKKGKLAVEDGVVHPVSGGAKTKAALKKGGGRKAGTVGNSYGKVPKKGGRTKGNA